MLEEYQQAAKDKGFDIFGADSSSQSSTKKGFATASQDSIDELNGRFTAGQIAWEETKNQAIEQTSLLSSINEKMSALCATPETGSSTDIVGNAPSSDGLREILVSGFAQHDNFSGLIVEHLIAVKGEVMNIRNTVEQMEQIRVNELLDISTIADHTSILAKNSPKMLSYSEETKRACKSLAGT